MLLIYVQRLTNRLGYTINVVMKHLLKTDFEITTSRDAFEQYNGAKFCYCEDPVGDSLWLQPASILFETSIQGQELHYHEYEGTPAIFPVYNRRSMLPFDVLAASFYMVSRYEEYLPHHTDIHGRFLAEESLAYQKGFLQTAVVDRWALMLKDRILQQYPQADLGKRSFEFVETVDIDSAYCYRNKGFFRTCIGLARDILQRKDFEAVRDRFAVLTGKMDDPYDTFEYLLDHKRSKLIFFVHLGDYGTYDKPTSYLNENFRDLLNHLADHAKMGIHPSYDVLEHPEKVGEQSGRLQNIVHREIKRSRFHFLRLNMPDSYRAIIDAEILNDYSMGFAEETGFRAGTCSTFPFFDLTDNHETQLWIHPFCLMDTTLQKYKKLTPEESLEQIRQLIDEVKAVDGKFIGIWHNQNLSEKNEWKGWRQVLERAIDYAVR